MWNPGSDPRTPTDPDSNLQINWLRKRGEQWYLGLIGLAGPMSNGEAEQCSQSGKRTLMSWTTWTQNTSNNCTSSGMPLNLRAGPSFSFPLGSEEVDVDSDSESFSGSIDSAFVVVIGDVGIAQSLLSSDVENPDEDAWQPPFCLAFAFWDLTFSARRFAAASSCLLVTSGSSLSASLAA